MRFQKLIGLAEWPAPEKTVICRQGTWMGRFQDQMVGIVQHPLLHLCRSAPENKHNGSVLPVQSPDRCVRELFPALAPMGISHMGADCQHRIQHQNTLFSPFHQITIIRDLTAQVIVKLLVNIYQKAESPPPASQKNRVREPVPHYDKDPGR